VGDLDLETLQMELGASLGRTRPRWRRSAPPSVVAGVVASREEFPQLEPGFVKGTLSGVETVDGTTGAGVLVYVTITRVYIVRVSPSLGND
jgi:hypothetical protein